VKNYFTPAPENTRFRQRPAKIPVFPGRESRIPKPAKKARGGVQNAFAELFGYLFRI
jgi:hypothetical protein